MLKICYFIILYIPVPHVEHLPFIAERPFFIVTFSVSFISFLALHFTQYPTSAIDITSFKINACVIVYQSNGIKSSPPYWYSLRPAIYFRTFSGTRYLMDRPDLILRLISSDETSIGVMTTVSTSLGTSANG